MRTSASDYVTRVLLQPAQVDAAQWDALLDAHADGQRPGAPFMRHAFLKALHDSGSATAATGWTPCFMTLWRGERLAAACPVYLKTHSYGEYVFDWAWANAYEQHGLAYYPKALVAVPFTPVPGPRLLAIDAHARSALVRALCQWCEAQGVSSLHLLFGDDADIAACEDAGLMLRHQVQFHWSQPAAPHAPLNSFDDLLTRLSQDKRKKIRQERRKVHEAGVHFRHAQGDAITETDWDFFYRCYEHTYLAHGNPPYLSRDFFARMARELPQHWLLFVAERAGRPIASSLIALGESAAPGGRTTRVAYGRYWGALEPVDCLHFEACYYQPLQWCMANGYDRFEGGAQGEHKMARALMPVRTTSAHWLAHPGFADAVKRFLEREGQGMDHYVEHLSRRSPFRREPG